MFDVGHRRGARRIGLALAAGLLAFQGALALGMGAVGIPGLFLVPFAHEGRTAQGTPGGETVVSKLAEEAVRLLNAESASATQGASSLPGLPRLEGLADIPWDREAAPEKPKSKIFAGNIDAGDKLPWDAVEPVPFAPLAASSTTRRKSSALLPEPSSAPPSPQEALPASGDVEAWVKASATQLKGEDRHRPIYHFELWLEPPAAIRKRLVAVSYEFNTPAVLPQSQISHEGQTGFRIRAGGLTCADNVTVTLKFDDGRSQQVAVDSCRLLG
jgi:hypothetical protein